MTSAGLTRTRKQWCSSLRATFQLQCWAASELRLCHEEFQDQAERCDKERGSQAGAKAILSGAITGEWGELLSSGFCCATDCENSRPTELCLSAYNVHVVRFWIGVHLCFWFSLTCHCDSCDSVSMHDFFALCCAEHWMFLPMWGTVQEHIQPFLCIVRSMRCCSVWMSIVLCRTFVLAVMCCAVWSMLTIWYFSHACCIP